MDYAKLELDASQKGWRCSYCSLFIDCTGRPIFGDELWTIQTTSIHWIENRPSFNYCPCCGMPFEKVVFHGEEV